VYLAYKLLTRRRPIENKSQIAPVVVGFGCGTFSWVKEEQEIRVNWLILVKN
jgi:hypothetical protein